MSKPRYRWWGGVKSAIRAYPKEHGKCGAFSREADENAAVEQAITKTLTLPDGEQRMRLVSFVFWEGGYKLPEAAIKIPCSEKTARRWHNDFIRLAGKHMGYSL